MDCFCFFFNLWSLYLVSRDCVTVRWGLDFIIRSGLWELIMFFGVGVFENFRMVVVVFEIGLW